MEKKEKKQKEILKVISRNDTQFKNLEPGWIGESIEEKVRRITESNAPIEAISPMIYTERKDGVLPQYDIRTDKWDIAQQAMDTIAQGKRQKRAEKIAKAQENENTTKKSKTNNNPRTEQGEETGA